jgi:hypothetical protein
MIFKSPVALKDIESPAVIMRTWENNSEIKTKLLENINGNICLKK